MPKGILNPRLNNLRISGTATRCICLSYADVPGTLFGQVCVLRGEDLEDVDVGTGKSLER